MYPSTKRAFSSSCTQHCVTRPVSEQRRATTHDYNGLSRARECQHHTMPTASPPPASGSSLAGTGRRSKHTISGYGGRRANASAVSLPGRVESYPGRFTVDTGNNSARIFSSVQTQTSPLQWRGPVTDYAQKPSRSETGSSQSARERSDRARPSERAGKRLLQPLLCGAKERWWTPSDSGSETHQPSTSQARVQNDNAETDLGTDTARGLVRLSGSKRRILPYSNSDAPQALPEVCFRRHGLSVFSAPVRPRPRPPHIFKVCGRSAFSPQIERNAHLELSGRLADFSPLKGCANQSRGNTASPFGYAGTACEYAEERVFTEPDYNISGSMFGLDGDASSSLSRANRGNFIDSASFQTGQVGFTEGISEAFGTDGGGFFSVPSGSAAYAAATVLAEDPSSAEGVVFRPQAHYGHSQLRQHSETVEQPGYVQPRSSFGYSDAAHRGLDGRVDCRLGSSMPGRSCLRPVVGVTEKVAHKPFGIGSGVLSPTSLSVEIGAATCTDSNRQHVCGLVHKSPGRRAFQSSFQTGSESPVVGGPTLSLLKSGAHPRYPEPWSRHAFEERDSSRRVEASPRISSNDLGSIREGGSGFVCHKREHALSGVLLAISLPAAGRCSDIALAGSQTLRVPSGEDSAYGVVQNQEGESVSYTRGPELAESALVRGPERVSGGSPMANSPQKGPAVSGERHDMAPQPRAVEPSCVAAAGTLNERDALHSRVLSTLTEARAPSTRRLYALKWGVFTKWCQDIGIDQGTCSVSDVLRFLQHRLDCGSLPSTLKVYVAAIAAFRSPVDGQSIGKHALVISFLRGARRLCPSRPPSVPPWDLALVLRALSLPPFEPLASIAVKELSLKTALLLALASAKRIGDLHAFSVNDDCICFGPGDCNVTLRPRPGYVPKSLNTPFRAQVVSLPALSAEPPASRDADAQSTVCPVRALRTYVDRSAAFRQSDQLFVCFGGCNKGRAVSKQRLSHWIVDAITLAYECQGKDCPLNIKAHSVRAIASSWAWARGMSIQDLCLAAGWSSQNTFARFYKLDVPSVASHVLSVS